MCWFVALSGDGFILPLLSLRCKHFFHFFSFFFFTPSKKLRVLCSELVLHMALNYANTFAQRSQRSGCSLSAPTVSEYFQQRAHLWPVAWSITTATPASVSLFSASCGAFARSSTAIWLTRKKSSTDISRFSRAALRSACSLDR